MWRSTHAGECPTTDKLLADGLLDRASRVTDAWNNPFKILCVEDETTVVSFGRDQKEGTADDIDVPSPPQRPQP